MNKVSIKIKIIFLVTLFFIISLAATAYYNYGIVLNELEANERQRASVILNTITPMIAASLSFDSERGAIEVIKNIHAANKEIEETEIRIFSSQRVIKLENRQKDDIYGSFALIQIIYNITTDDPIAEMKTTFCRKNYEKSAKSTTDFLLKLIAFYFVGLIILLLLIEISIRPLSILTEKLKGFHPEDKNFTIEKSDSKDEIGTIHNVIKRLLDQVSGYSNEINHFNIYLSEVVKDKTKKLEKLNYTLEEKIKEEVAKNREKDRMIHQQAKLASMGEMIGNIAHQWRQPLTAIGNSVQDLKDAYAYNELTKEYMEDSVAKTMEYIRLMSNTIDDFRNFYNNDKEKRWFSVEETVKSAITIVEATFKNSFITINLNIRNDVKIFGFSNEYAQVLLNVFNNTRDAFSISCREKKVMDIILEEESGRSKLTVSDNAGGIDDKIIDKIFEPYFTTKHQFHGTGIGLFMSKQMIEGHMNGKIYVNNNKDAQGTRMGAVFTIIV